jgi:DNA-binding MurR/RpiR family transcriptional regulator
MLNESLAINNLPHNVFIRLQSVYPSLKSAERKAADFLLCNANHVVVSNITETAIMASCSEATLVRLAKRLGFMGFPDLRDAITSKQESAETFYEEILPDDKNSDVVRKVFNASIRSIEDSLNILDMVQFSEAVDALLKANRIQFVGNGDATAAALAGFSKFTRIGVNSYFSNEFDVQLIHASLLTAGDVLVAISYSGRTRTVLDVVKRARRSKATVIAITNFPSSPLIKNSDMQLISAAFLQNTIGEVMIKRIPEFCLIESLYIAYTLHRSSKIIPCLENTEEALKVNKL